MDFIFNNIDIIFWVPLWAFLIIMLGHIFSVKINYSIACYLTLFSSLLGIFFCGFGLFLLTTEQIIEKEFNFIQIKNFIITGGLYIDKISLIFALTLFLISFFVQLFSVSYIQKETSKYRFFALLNLFNSAMVLLFFSPNLFQAYFFWEIVSVISYLLIGFEYKQKRKSVTSQKVFIINRIGDMFLLSGFIFCSYFLFSYSENIGFTMLPFADMNAVSTLIYVYTTTPVFLVICSLFTFSACVKSAQIPFFPWLQDAMEAKLPVSALLHSATMVALGIFLLIRISAFFVLMPVILKLITIIGLLTAFICSICACTKNNPKKVLAYSTSAQLGLMFFSIGLLNIKACLILFVAHAFIKTLLFLTLPTNNKWNNLAFILFLLSGLSLIGLLFAGLSSKEFLYTSCENTLYKIFLNFIVFLTAFYTVRLVYQLINKYAIQKTKQTFYNLFSFLGLFFMNFLLYLVLKKLFKYKIMEPFWIGLASSLFIYFLYFKNKIFKIKFLYPLGISGFYLDSFYTTVISKQYGTLCYTLNNFETTISNSHKIVLFLTTRGVFFIQRVENTLNNIIIYLTKSVRNISKFNSVIQTKNIQQYNGYAFLIIAAIIFYFVITHTM